MRGSRNFRQGGSRSVCQKSSDNVSFFFFSPQVHFTEVKCSISKKSIIFKVPEGSNIYQGGSYFFQGGSNCLFPIETHITCDFQWGVRTPCPPLWIRTCSMAIGAVCSGSTPFASILNSSVMLGNYLQQTTSADDIFKCIFFLALLGLTVCKLGNCSFC